MVPTASAAAEAVAGRRPPRRRLTAPGSLAALLALGLGGDVAAGVSLGRNSRGIAAATFSWPWPSSDDAAAAERAPGFLIISSPTTSNVYFAELPSFSELSKPLSERASPPQARVLIDGSASKCTGSECTNDSDEGLRQPEGLALHQGRESATLYVADVEAKNIYAYELAGGGGWSSTSGSSEQGPGAGLRVGRQRRVRHGVEGVSGLAVDGVGNLFYTVAGGQVEMVSAESLTKGILSQAVLYDAQQYPTVSTPAGIAADGSHIYWANSAGGGDSGTVAAALERPTGAAGDAPIVIAANGAGAAGVCLARSNVFYTGDTASLFAVKQSGGGIAEVSRDFQQPRGCAHDGENTLYVADAGANAVFSLPAVSSLRAVQYLSKVATVDSPIGVAVFTAVGGELQGPELEMYHSGSSRGAGDGVVGPATAAATVAAASTLVLALLSG